MAKIKSVVMLAGGLCAGVGVCGYLCASDRSSDEFAKVEQLLDLKAGSRVAEIGAGNGEMSFRAAERVGRSGHVFATELDTGKLHKIREGAERRKLSNVTGIEGGETDTKLPPGCCDAVFLRHVYHHITQPSEIDRSIHEALKPGGLVVVVDFPPKKLLALWTPKGTPQNRGGHGVPRAVVVEEFTATGFELVSADDHWSGSDYCVVFRKR